MGGKKVRNSTGWGEGVCVCVCECSRHWGRDSPFACGDAMVGQVHTGAHLGNFCLCFSSSKSILIGNEFN